MNDLELRFLPARQGDAIWVRWGDGHQLLIDMGTRRTGLAIAKRLRELPEAQRKFELLVITHVDTDHIGGVLSGLVELDEPIPGLEFADVWFNGFDHLKGQKAPLPNGHDGLQPMGPVQGEQLSDWLRDRPWNEAFGRAPVIRTQQPVTLHGLKITVLGPTQDRLKDLIPDWSDVVESEVVRDEHVGGGLEPMGPKAPPELRTRRALEELATPGPVKDTSKANGTSIALLLEWKGRRALLTGDGYAADLAEALRLHNGGQPVAVDVVKLPHHGSKHNVSKDLVEMLSATHWIFSSDGTTFGHPDAPAVGRVLQFRRQAQPVLGFNVPSEFNEWWDNPTWQDLFGYTTEYGTETDGLTVRLPPV